MLHQKWRILILLWNQNGRQSEILWNFENKVSIRTNVHPLNSKIRIFKMFKPSLPVKFRLKRGQAMTSCDFKKLLILIKTHTNGLKGISQWMNPRFFIICYGWRHGGHFECFLKRHAHVFRFGSIILNF